MIVTGIVVNSKATASKCIYRELDNAIRYINLFGVSNHIKHLGLNYDSYSYKQHLYGLACFVNMIDHEKGKKYINQLDKLKFDEVILGD